MTRKSWMAELKPEAAKGAAGKSAAGGRAAAGPVTRQGQGILKSTATPRKTAAPAGSGLTSERMREQMVARLRAAGIRNAAVLDAMGRVPRHLFVDKGLASRAYEDTALPIGHNQTISQPFIVARMAELLLGGMTAPTRVLDIGTGCGYQAAVLAQLERDVYSIERIRALHDRARANLRPLRIANLRLVYGDGMAGLPEVAPFDGIVAAAAADRVPPGLPEQLAVGGRLIIPVGGAQQSLRLIVRTAPDKWTDQELEPVMFVPLRSGMI